MAIRAVDLKANDVAENCDLNASLPIESPYLGEGGEYLASCIKGCIATAAASVYFFWLGSHCLKPGVSIGQSIGNLSFGISPVMGAFVSLIIGIVSGGAIRKGNSSQIIGPVCFGVLWNTCPFH